MNLIVATSINRVIGDKGTLPWRLSDELKLYKETTIGSILVMGRKTFTSIGKPLHGRESWVLTRDENFEAPEGVRIFHTKEDVLKAAGEAVKPVFINGGAEIYKLFMPYCTRLYITTVEAEIAGDTYFPRFNLNDWEKLAEYSHRKDEKNTFAWTQRIYEKAL